MSYIIPSVLVYQQLAGSGGVANISPDLDACIIGPCNNVVKYDPSTATNLTKSRGKLIDGSPASLSSSAVNVYLPSTKVGQVLDETSLAVYINKAQVETKKARATVPAGGNVFTISTMTGFTVSTQVNSKIVTFDTAPTQLYLNDFIKIPGAGTAGADLEGYVTLINGTAVTISQAAKTAVASAAVTRTGFYNKNPLTNTPLIEVGDPAEYALSGVGGGIVSTSVIGITAVGDKVTKFTLADKLPATEPGGTTYSVVLKKVFNDLLLPVTYGSVTNYDASNTAASGYVVVNAINECIYGTVKSGDVHVQYKALRLDLGGSVLDIANIDDQIGVLGAASDDNPLALGVNLALANTTGRIRCIAVQSDDLSGYLDALDLAENTRLYALCPLTQRIDILTAFQQHVEQMSTPEMASWRVAYVNTAIPATANVGMYSKNLVNAGATVTLDVGNGKYYLLANNATFVSDGVVPGDIVQIKTHDTPPTPKIKSLTVLAVKSNQELEVSAPTANLTGVNYWVERNLSKVQQAEAVAAQSTTFGSSRVLHVQPDMVGVVIDNVTKYLPGYYACAALAGLTSGLPAQKGLTNIGLAGIVDLTRSNFYFTRAQINTMAAAGTFLLVQEAQGTIPYVMHSLTTDMTVLQYREIQQVKNIDYLSYYFFDILKGFPGRYNITPDTLQTLRATIDAAAKRLQGRILPKLGAPLLTFQIKTLKQSPENRDTVIVELPVTIPTVMNYVNLYLIV